MSRRAQDKLRELRAEHARLWDDLEAALARFEADPSEENAQDFGDLEHDLTGDCEASTLAVEDHAPKDATWLEDW